LIALGVNGILNNPTPTPIQVVARAPTQAPSNTSVPTNTSTRLPTQTPFVVTATPLPTPTFTATPRVTSAPGAGDTRAFPPDNAPMQFVSAGDFKMGSDDSDKGALSNEKPQHTVYLDAFWMDKFEVTNALYKKCVDAGKCSRLSETKSYTRSAYFGDAQFDNYPVIYVTWDQARTYCEWAGKRLPTEAEWEKAARGTDGRIYPWGNTWDVRTTRRLNFSDKNDPTGPSDTEADDGYADTAPVGTYPNGASPYGIMDLSGNVWEWVSDWYASYSSGTQRNPTGPSSGQYRVLRGGAWLYVGSSARAALRGYDTPTHFNRDVGFRCARSP
jgi:formylglycine-generating enzyme required for sulfatase activity